MVAKQWRRFRSVPVFDDYAAVRILPRGLCAHRRTGSPGSWLPRRRDLRGNLVEPGRVNIFERWESQAALETFRSSGPDTEQRRGMLTVSLQRSSKHLPHGLCSGRVRNESCRTDSAATDEFGAAVRSYRTTTNNEKGPATVKLTTTTTAVMQGLGGPDEDRRGGFERGGWALPLFDNEAETFLAEVYQRADAFLFGRRTYEIFAGSWGTGSWGANQGNNPISVALNTRPKYVASTTLTDPQWADTTVLSGDVAAAVGELKAKPGRELQVHGSGNLVRWLVDNHLVDEITLLTYPVVVGQGTRLFPATGPDTALELVDSRATPSGVTIQVYRPTGRPQYATATT